MFLDQSGHLHVVVQNYLNMGTCRYMSVHGYIGTCFDPSLVKELRIVFQSVTVHRHQEEVLFPKFVFMSS